MTAEVLVERILANAKLLLIDTQALEPQKPYPDLDGKTEWWRSLVCDVARDERGWWYIFPADLVMHPPLMVNMAKNAGAEAIPYIVENGGCVFPPQMPQARALDLARLTGRLR